MENTTLSILIREGKISLKHQGDTQRGRHEAEGRIHKLPEAVAERGKEQILARGPRRNMSLLTP